ncbi:MAG: hypothetical protein WHT06_08400 [Desulfobacterales bacterium]
MHHDEPHPPGPASPGGAPGAREKLRIRLEHALRHSAEHGASYRELAREAERLGETEAARRLQALERLTAEQARALEEALAALGAR